MSSAVGDQLGAFASNAEFSCTPLASVLYATFGCVSSRAFVPSRSIAQISGCQSSAGQPFDVSSLPGSCDASSMYTSCVPSPDHPGWTRPRDAPLVICVGVPPAASIEKISIGAPGVGDAQYAISSFGP